jgi:cyclopropane fatty-acyl-phospholipid synthase-like methyltransferase
MQRSLETTVVTSYANVPEVVAHFEGKTAAILKRYGPGPRVHYHAGLVDHPPQPNVSAQSLRVQLVAAQERMLSYAANIWDAPSTLINDVLDVGCGLGGGAIYWAQEFGAQVTAVTCVASHVNWVKRFAEQAGVGSHVRPLLCDALKVPGENRFNAVIAVDSSSYLPREQWLPRTASLLRPGGRVFIIDCFLAQLEYAEPFDRYWHTRIGTIDEYLAAARESNLRAVSVEDISHRTVHFWTTTLALIRTEAQNRELRSTELARYEESLGAHSLVREGLNGNGLRYCLMSFRKDG